MADTNCTDPRNAFERVILANGGVVTENAHGVRSYAIDCDDIEWAAVLAQREEDRAEADAAEAARAAAAETSVLISYADHCRANGWAVS